MTGTLFVVATPIGNLEDITLRAVRVLREVSLIAAEDTRRTAKLLNHFGIATPTTSFHEHNRQARLPVLLARLREGASIALVSDAGTPLLSDPGLDLVQGCITEGIAVDAVPGASAPLALGVLSGFPMYPMTVMGFSPHRSSDRKAWLAGVAAIDHPVTFFESPHRVRALLADIAEICGDRPMCLGRELTKVHQQVLRGTATQIGAQDFPEKGEFTVMLGPAVRTAEAPVQADDAGLLSEFRHVTDSGGLGRREGLRVLAQRHGLSQREVFAALERAKQESVEDV